MAARRSAGDPNPVWTAAFDAISAKLAGPLSARSGRPLSAHLGRRNAWIGGVKTDIHGCGGAALAPQRDRGLWRTIKCLNGDEFVVVGWTDPESSRPHLGALLLAYYAPDSRLVYAGRAGTCMNADQLRRLRELLLPLATTEMPLDVRPPKGTRVGWALVLSRIGFGRRW